MRHAWLCLSLLGCAASDPSGGDPSASSGPRAPASSGPAPSAAPPGARPTWAVDGDTPACADVRRRFSETLAKATGACATAADCGCYDPVAAGLGCGGVTDAATAKALRDVEAELHANRCRWPHSCGPWACAPRCESGRCAR